MESNRPDTTGMFHIVNGVVHSCDGGCQEIEHWTTLDHALASQAQGRITTGDLVVHRAPTAANATRPEPLDVDATVLTNMSRMVPVFPNGAAPADYEVSVVNRTYEVDPASFDMGDTVMQSLWLALADHDSYEIVKATQVVMDWSNGLVDGMRHPLVSFNPIFGADDPRGVMFNGKLQRLAADMYCGGWTALQREVENRWIIPSMMVSGRMDHLLNEMSNPLAYLESTRLAVLTMQDAMAGTAVQDLKTMSSSSVRSDVGWMFDLLGQWVANIDKDDERPDRPTYMGRRFDPSGRRREILEKASHTDATQLPPNASQDAMALGFSETMSPLEPMFAAWAENHWMESGSSESYNAAAWKLARSVWSHPDGPEGDQDDPIMASDPLDRPIDTCLMKTAMEWFVWVYQNPQVSGWIQQIPADHLDPWRKLPMTGKIDKLHRMVGKRLDMDGVPHAVVAERAIPGLRAGRLFYDMAV